MNADLIKALIAGQTRTWGVFAAGALLHWGVINSDQTSGVGSAVAAVAAGLIFAAWSAYQKKGISGILADFATLKGHVNAIPTTIATPAPVATAVATAKAAASVLALAIVLGLLMGHGASAQTRKPLTGNPIKDIQNAVTGAQTKITSDLTSILSQIEGLVDTADAINLAVTIPALQDTIGQACWKSFDSLSQVAKAHPVPLTLKIASDIEALRLTAMALNQICTNPNCGQMWTDAQNAAEALNVTPMQFSLPSLCAKIPAIGTLAGAAVAPVTPAANALGANPTPAVPGAPAAQ